MLNELNRSITFVLHPMLVFLSRDDQGLVTVPLHTTLTQDEVDAIVQEAELKTVVCSQVNAISLIFA